MMEKSQWLLTIWEILLQIVMTLFLQSFARGIQEELFTQEQFHFIAEEILSDGGPDKRLIR